MSSDKRNILISGASRGIGRCIAEKAIQDGHNISIGLRDLKCFKNSEYPHLNKKSERILVERYDAKDKISANLWAKKTKQTFGKIDTLIHCAGIFKRTPLNYTEKEENDINELWKVNVLGPWILTRACWKYLTENNNSRVIVLVSMSGKRSKGKLAGYTASKFALMGLCQTIRNEGWEQGLRVSTINPGWVNTRMASEVESIKKEEMTQPEDIGEIVSKILELPNSCIPFEININCNLERSK